MVPNPGKNFAHFIFTLLLAGLENNIEFIGSVEP
jgi:hypothetical protein